MILLLAAIVLAGCGPNRPGQRGQSQTTGMQNLNPTTVDDLLSAITKAGLAAPNPRDVTQRDCPAIGCSTKVDTDTVSIMEFPTAGRAELYAATIHNRLLVEDVVMTFSPSLPAAARPAYESAVKGAIG